MLIEMIEPVSVPAKVTSQSAMTPEQCCHDLQWQPMMLGVTKSERLAAEREQYAQNRARRAEKQRQREEAVLFMQSLLCMGLCFMVLVSLTALL